MANGSSVAMSLPTERCHCKVCDLHFDTIDSLQVHLRYHKENLYRKWSTQKTQTDTNDRSSGTVKKKILTSAPAGTSDNIIMFNKPNTDFKQRATPESSVQFLEPATPQSHRSAPSPYQNPEQMNFPQFGNNHTNYGLQQNQQAEQMNWEQNQHSQAYHIQNRFPPYNMSERVHLNPPTPSPSPSKGDKCGLVCDSAVQLNENFHPIQVSASSISVSSPLVLQSYSRQLSHSQNIPMKHDNEESNILDLDSHVVVCKGNDSELNPSAPLHDAYLQSQEVNTSMIPVNFWDPQQINSDNRNGAVTFLNDQKNFIECNSYVSDAQVFDPELKFQKVGGKSANWKSNDARRPKTYKCTACNKWFTSSGHLKRHYNTTLHKNAVRLSGQPDPATLPVSSHRHQNRDMQNRAQQQPVDSNLQIATSSKNSRNIDEGLRPPYATQNCSQSHPVTTMQPATSTYAHILQGNVDNSFCNNSLANHPLQQQVPSHLLNIGSQPLDISNLNEFNHPDSKNIAISITTNPLNGEASPSIPQMLSLSSDNISSPVQFSSTPTYTAHMLPSINNLGINPYSMDLYSSANTLGPLVTDPAPTSFYLGQTVAPSYPNGMPPHVTDMAINNLPITNPAISEVSTEIVETVKQEQSKKPAGGALPSFSQLRAQTLTVYVPNYVTKPNVGGPVLADESTASFIIVDSVFPEVQFSNTDYSTQNIQYEDTVAPQTIKENIGYVIEQNKPPAHDVNEEVKMMKCDENILRSENQYQILKIEDIMDYANKENRGADMKLPATPESTKAESGSNNSSHVVSSTVSTSPLTERNKLQKSINPKIHKCFECDKTFNKRCYLTQHNKTVHSGDKPFKCNRCGKRFPDDTSFEWHYIKHADNKPFKCSQCPKSFNHKSDLRRHMCLHSGTMPFSCDICGKGFLRKDHMVKHGTTHRPKQPSTSSPTSLSQVTSSVPSTSSGNIKKHMETTELNMSSNNKRQTSAPADTNDNIIVNNNIVIIIVVKQYQCATTKYLSQVPRSETLQIYHSEPSLYENHEFENYQEGNWSFILHIDG